MTNATSPSASTRDWILIVTLAAIWGSSFLFGRILMLEWPPFTVGILRPVMTRNAHSVMAAKATRRKTTVKGGHSSIRIL
ncbi:MAG: hypothetical protein AAFX96_03580, partial [Pseudomonadota bacterium]